MLNFLALRHRWRDESPGGRPRRLRFHRARRLPAGRRNAHRPGHQAAKLAGPPRRSADRDGGGRRARSQSADEEARAAGDWISPRSATSTAYESPTGEYTINVYLVKNDKRSTLLGSTTVNVKEFLPDRMKIETRLSKTSRARLGRSEGNERVDRARESLRHAGHRSADQEPRRAFARLSSRFRNSGTTAFTIRCSTRKKERQHETGRSRRTERRTRTDDAELDLQLDRFADATYSMQFFAEAFEGEGGRSITGQASALVSALPYVVGYKSRRRPALHQREHAARGRFARGRSAAQPDRARERDAERDRAGTRLGRDEEGERQLRLRVGLEGAGRENREDRDQRGRTALSAADGRARRLRRRVAGRRRPQVEPRSASPSSAAAS